MLIKENRFCAAHFTTARACGNMKDGPQRAKLSEISGLDCGGIVLARQVHSAAVVPVTKKDSGGFIENCDGLITGDKGLPLGIFTADCIPVLMVSKDMSVRAAVHAGWKGLAAAYCKTR